jgi:A/G-specific adenine glycosylase
VDPYAVLVSEVMLQQTQVATVLGGRYFERWLERFPDAAALAAADEDAVLKAWEGLGYYRRARALQGAARALIDRHGGRFPRDPDKICELPGVGRYTAGAVASFAFDVPAPLVDGNVARVFARLFDFREPVDSPAGQRRLWAWAAALVPRGGGRAYNSALMELGQRVCTPANPACAGCPVASWCLCPGPSSLPRKRPAPATEAREERVVWVRRRGEVLLAQESGGRRCGLWRLPERTASEVAGLPVLHTSSYNITRFRVSLSVYGAAGAPAGKRRRGERWVPDGRVGGLAFGSPYRRAVSALGDRLDPGPAPPDDLGRPGRGS